MRKINDQDTTCATQLVDYVKAAKVFRRNKKNVEFKILAAIILLRSFLEKKQVIFLSLFEEISHESVENILPQT